jgi:hypothetical protein
MNKFDEKYSYILNELNILRGIGNVAKFTTGAIQGFNAAFQDPKKLFELWQNWHKKDRSGKGEITRETGVFVGQWVIYAKTIEVIGQVMSQMNHDGEFEVALKNKNGTPSDYCFVKTKKKPEWNLVKTSSLVPTDPIINGPNRMGTGSVPQKSPSKELPTQLVGGATKFPKWIDYDTFVKKSRLSKFLPSSTGKSPSTITKRPPQKGDTYAGKKNSYTHDGTNWINDITGAKVTNKGVSDSITANWERVTFSSP